MSIIAMSITSLINVSAYFLAKRYDLIAQNFANILSFTLNVFALEYSTISNSNAHSLVAFLPLITYISTLTYC
jgi:hypothetical protein